jgi:SAM-dependent methyltransferase
VSYAAAVRNLTLHFLRQTNQLVRGKFQQAPPPLDLRPWRPLSAKDVPNSGAWCVVCDWHGERFEGGFHSESAICPRCRSVARDRFLYLCMIERVPYQRGLRVLETSPRLGEGYRETMVRRVDYLASDYYQGAHQVAIKLDLMRIDLPDESLDLVLTAHVLEHVPDPDAALSELHRVLRPGGRLLIQVPLGQALTAPPLEPEFHEDNAPVFWRFGLDFTHRLRKQGFTTTLLVTRDFRRRVLKQDTTWPEGISGEWDPVAMVSSADPADLTVIVDDTVAERSWLRPSYMHTAWECVKPGR